MYYHFSLYIPCGLGVGESPKDSTDIKPLRRLLLTILDTYGGQSQPSDGGVGGHGNTNNGGGRSNNERSGEDRGGSRDPPQAPSSRGGGSSSSGDNGGDDPNKKRPTRDKAKELMEVESKEEETSENDESQASNKGEMVTNKLPPPPPGGRPQLTDANRHMHQGSSVVTTVCSNPWSSSSHASLKSFEQSEQLRMCPLEEMVVHEVSNDEGQSQQQQQPQSAASIGEEQLNLELFNSPATGGILDQVNILQEHA